MLSDIEYQALLSQSPSFMAMDESDKKRISSAVMVEREEYIQIFTQEMEMLQAANKQFLNQNDLIVMDFKTTVKKDRQNRLKKAEEADQAEAEKLLNPL